MPACGGFCPPATIAPVNGCPVTPETWRVVQFKVSFEVISFFDETHVTECRISTRDLVIITGHNAPWYTPHWYRRTGATLAMRKKNKSSITARKSRLKNAIEFIYTWIYLAWLRGPTSTILRYGRLAASNIYLIIGISFVWFVNFVPTYVQRYRKGISIRWGMRFDSRVFSPVTWQANKKTSSYFRVRKIRIIKNK